MKGSQTPESSYWTHYQQKECRHQRPRDMSTITTLNCVMSQKERQMLCDSWRLQSWPDRQITAFSCLLLKSDTHDDAILGKIWRKRPASPAICLNLFVLRKISVLKYDETQKASLFPRCWSILKQMSRLLYFSCLIHEGWFARLLDCQEVPSDMKERKQRPENLEAAKVCLLYSWKARRIVSEHFRERS